MSAPQGKYGELSHDATMDVIRQLSECGIFSVNLSGGEPLIRPDFMEIVAELSRMGITVGRIYTNGLLLDEGVLDGLERLGQHPAIVLSFDGVGHHDWLRGVSGAEEAVYKALTLCAKRDFSTSVQMCLHRGNIGSLRETVRRLASLGCGRLSAGRIANLGNWNVHGTGLAPTEAMRAEDTEAAIKLAAEKGIEFAAEELVPAALLTSDGKELDDAELEAVAGGGSWDSGPNCPAVTGL